MTKTSLALQIILMAVLSACGGRYTFNNESFSNPKDALAAHDLFMDKIIEEIPVREESIVAKIVVITPNKTTAEALAITRTGGGLAKESTEYLGQFLEDDFQLNGRALKKSKAFSNIELKVVDFPAKEARASIGKYSAVFYMNLVSPTQVGWYMLKTNDSPPVQINPDAIAKGSKRVDSWITSTIKVYQDSK